MNGYGCVKCQRHHYERDRDGLYAEHLMFQSKHGIYRISERDWAFGTLVAARQPEQPKGEQP